MENFTFATIEYVRPDFDTFEKESLRMVEELQKADSYEAVKKVLERREELENSIETMCTVA
jgi:hypothetical protein